MSGAAFLRVKKLKGGGIITVAARHNKRVIQAELGATGSIDPTRSSLNELLAGPSTAAEVGQLAKDLMTAAGVTKLRKDAVMALEIVFSLPPGHTIDDRAYFSDCATWAEHHFGGVILSVDVHKDEAQDHAHVLLLPLTNGRMDGGRMVGNKQKLTETQTQFHLKVAARYGLRKAPAKLSGASKQAAAQAVLQKLRETGDSALQSVAWATIRAMIESEPGPFLLALGIDHQAPQKKLRTMAQIFTSKGKGSAKEVKSIDFAPAQKERSLCSVDFASNAPPPPATTAPQPAPAAPPTDQWFDDVDQPLTDKPNADGEVAPPAHTAVQHLPDVNDVTLPDTQDLDQPNEISVALTEAPFVEPTRVVRDSDLDPNQFFDGDYYPQPPPPARLKRQAADAWVGAALASRSKPTPRPCVRH